MFVWSGLERIKLGCTCDSVGRAVTSDTRVPQFKSSHRQILLTINCIKSVPIQETKKEKEEWLIF